MNSNCLDLVDPGFASMEQRLGQHLRPALVVVAAAVVVGSVELANVEPLTWSRAGALANVADAPVAAQ